MTDLKTLKGIFDKVVDEKEVELIDNFRCGGVDWFTEGILENYNGMLRREIIKWIKELRKENKEIGEYTYVENAQAFIKVVQNNALIKGIKHFGNITEEDLSNG